MGETEPAFTCSDAPASCDAACEAALATSVCADEGDNCACSGTIYYGRRYVHGMPGSGQETTLQQLKGVPEVCASQEGIDCQCDGKVYFSKKFHTGSDAEENTFDQVLENKYKVLNFKGSVLCNSSTFYPNGDDPDPKAAKFCYCETHHYREKAHVKGKLPCKASTFGSDPLPNVTKYCYCQGKSPSHGSGGSGGKAATKVCKTVKVLSAGKLNGDQAEFWLGGKRIDSPPSGSGLNMVTINIHTQEVIEKKHYDLSNQPMPDQTSKDLIDDISHLSEGTVVLMGIMDTGLEMMSQMAYAAIRDQLGSILEQGELFEQGWALIAVKGAEQSLAEKQGPVVETEETELPCTAW